MTDIAIYEGPGGQIEVRVDRENIWLAQMQLVELFGDQSVVSRPVRNVFADGELEPESNMQKMHIAGADKHVALYNLEVIISVGYRVKSREGVRFRQWATRTLRYRTLSALRNTLLPMRISGELRVSRSSRVA